MSQISFRRMANELATRAARATVGLMSPADDALRRYLIDRFEQSAGKSGSFLAEPVCEAMFPWMLAEETLGDLAGGVLHEKTIAALDAGGFKRDQQPYVHQKRAWELLLRDKKSLVVTSGTGSGKTECFLVPILDDLVRQAEGRGRLVGVQALFLYPLNALIASQKDRLSSWFHPLNGDVRFALYNGNTPETVKATEARGTPEEACDRATIRRDPPSVLVTNATMLEYMLVRKQDEPILAQSKGKLRWVVLDEAHTYVGSNAAEIALLLRRVMNAFGVSPDDVQFIATSATIGTDDDRARSILRDYLADLAGIDASRVEVIAGKRRIPKLSAPSREVPLEEVRASPVDGRYEMLANCRMARKARAGLSKGTGALKLSDLAKTCGASSLAETLELLDLCHPAKEDGVSFLPIRMHFFQRTQVGLWSCVNPGCKGSAGTPKPEGWAYGPIFGERRVKCPDCGSLVFEILLCSRCGEPHLQGVERDVDGYGVQIVPEYTPLDDENGVDVDSGDEVEEPESDAAADDHHRRLLHVPFAFARRVTPFEHPQRVRVHDGLLCDEEDGTILAHVLQDRRCLRCGERSSPNRDAFRSVRAGAPFYLQTSIPVLLEASDPHEQPLQKPMEGRRTLTFTDSRQGSARFALRLQLEAERNYVRSWVWHSLGQIRRKETLAPGEREELEKKLAVMRQHPDIFKEHEKAEVEKRLLGLRLPSMTWKEAASDLARTSTVREIIKPSWRDRYGPFTDEEVAHTLLMRELMHRPARPNSIETLGIATLDYDALEDGCPAEARSLGLASSEWRDFLRLLIDFQIRSRYALRMPDAVKTRWLGIKFHSHVMVAPRGRRAGKRSVPWPSTRGANGRPHRLARLLARAVDTDVNDPMVEDTLRAGWDSIRPLLDAEQDGFVLDVISQSRIVAVHDGWLCPVTRRVLPVTLRGWSPYLPEDSKFPRCPRVKLPALPFPWGQHDDGSAVSPEEISRWLNTDAGVVEARGIGIWGDLQDRLSRRPEIILAAEHSAQQPPSKLTQYTSEFKEGKLNVLSCSTTMEMGVDIGGLTTIAMNNAPPSPANFFQRAGRAGRRGETAAASLTMCKADPHGDAVFRNPFWPWERDIAPPRVSLSSEPILRRHLAAFALGRFLQGREALKLVSEAFFLKPSEDHPLAEDFLAWLKKDDTADALRSGLVRLVDRTPLAGKGEHALLEVVAGDLERVRDEWKAESEAAQQEVREQEKLCKDRLDKSPALTASKAVLRRIHGEYLLRDLSERCFLPAHGFPTGIVPFVTSNWDSIKRERASEGDEVLEHEDQRSSRAFPQRQLAMAIREYAPGNSITVDGKVYRSAGVTLNWKLPANADAANETQEFQFAWRCKDCGAGGAQALWPDHCPACGEGPVERQQFLQPAGFAVDFAEHVSNDDSDREYIPVEPPHVYAEGEWVSLADPALGRYRATAEGHVIHLSRGLHEAGYAICLECGRAASEESSQDGGGLPRELDGHFRLRGGGGKSADGLCKGNDSTFLIKRRQALGSDVTTSVFELQLVDVEGRAPRQEALGAVAVALRQAAAEKLGIEMREISWSITRTRANGARGHAIALFDTATGGAGYVPQLPEFVPELLRRAAKILDCPRKCDRACHACVLSFDTQYALEQIDRNAGLELLSQAFLLRLEPSPELRGLLGPGSALEAYPIGIALDAALATAAARGIRIYLGGEAAAWDLPSWSLRDAIFRWRGAELGVTIVVPKSDLQKATSETREHFRALVNSGATKVIAVDNLVAPRRPRLAAEIDLGDHHFLYAMSDEVARAPNGTWGVGTRVMRLRADGPLPPIAGIELIALDLAAAQKENLVGVLRPRTFKWHISETGANLLKLLAGASDEATRRLRDKVPIASIEYSDRYLQAAVALRVVIELVRAVAGDQRPRVTLRTSPKEANVSNGRSTSPFDLESRQMKDVGTRLLRDVFDPQSSVELLQKSSAEHKRSLVVYWDDGKHWTVDFDGGVGQDIESPSGFRDLKAKAVDDVVQKIRDYSFFVESRPGRPPQSIYVWRVG